MKKQPEITDATHKSIIDAFWIIYQQKPIDKITVKEIVETAHVHRSTFYRYFTDIYDLLNQLEQKVISEISVNLKKNCNTTDFNDLLSHADLMVVALKEYAPMIYHLTSPNGDIFFRNKLKEQVQLHFNSLGFAKNTSLATEYLFNFMFSCILSNLNFWYEHQNECSLEQICNMCKQMISSGLLQFTKNIVIQTN